MLGVTWSEPDASGLQSLVWRARWEQTNAEVWKEKLLTYNQEDCTALMKVVEFARGVAEEDGQKGLEPAGGEGVFPVGRVQEQGGLAHAILHGEAFVGG